MPDQNLTIHFMMFNDKVKLMNQLNSKNLTLSAAEARNLQADIFDLLNHYSALNRALHSPENRKSGGGDVLEIHMDGGKF